MNLNSTILALEFSTDRRSVAVVRGGRILSERVQDSGLASRVFTLIEGALRDAQVDRREIRRVAIGIGPGSYTGVRLAISVGQGWRLATESLSEEPSNAAPAAEIVAISSFEVLAAQLQGTAWLVSDAQRSEWAAIQAIDGRCVGAPTLISGDAVRELARNGRVIGAEVALRLGIGETEYPTAAKLGELAAMARETISAEQLEPVYLRAAAFVKAPPTRIIAGITD
jgi:tRNA threonylcarbamoyl adenosine modification protein YeaZ